jgi:hypothetical protein
MCGKIQDEPVNRAWIHGGWGKANQKNQKTSLEKIVA